MNTLTDVKKLSKTMVKLTIATEQCNPKHKIKLARILKRAFNIEAKMRLVISKLFPLLSDVDTDSKAYTMINSMTKHMDDRIGRRIQNPISRKVRRKEARDARKVGLVCT